MFAGRMPFNSPNTAKETGMMAVERIIVRTAMVRSRPTICASAGLAKTEPAVVEAIRIVVSSVEAPNTAQPTVTIAGIMNICHRTTRPVKASGVAMIRVARSSNELSENKTRKKSEGNM